MILKGIHVRNLRSIVSAYQHDFRSVSLVVGANSSGKSSFIRILPLLRQSVEAVKRGPILWYGRFVDFGVFKDAVSRGAENSEIEFGFVVQLQKNWEGVPSDYFRPYLPILNDVDVIIKLVIAEVPGTSSTFTKQIKIEILDHSITLNANTDGIVESILLDQNAITSHSSELRFLAGKGLFSVEAKQKQRNANIFSELASDRTSIPDVLIQEVSKLFHGVANTKTKRRLTRWLALGDLEKFYSHLKTLSDTTPTSADRIRKYNSSSAWIKKLQGLVIVDRLPQMLNEIASFLESAFRHVAYVGPLRATAERFYRQQDLAVDEVDPQGANLAMYLMGLSDVEREAFSIWCKEHIGFSVSPAIVGAHVSINLREADSDETFNIADMGFGYSQLLPVLARIWSVFKEQKIPTDESFRLRSRILGGNRDQWNIPRIIVIEQPELHLHPRLQSKLGILIATIAKVSKSIGIPLHLICETHSEAIINQIGILVARGDCDLSEVQILIFEKNTKSCQTTISHSSYTQEGMLKNWPFGFFLPVEE